MGGMGMLGTGREGVSMQTVGGRPRWSVRTFLGWLVLHEKVTGYIFVGSVVIICAVALVSGAKLIPRDDTQEQPDLPAVEAGAD
jgi:hypothetical protein